eukprot:5687749-Pyramimonas_sp.AAC.1
MTAHHAHPGVLHMTADHASADVLGATTVLDDYRPRVRLLKYDYQCSTTTTGLLRHCNSAASSIEHSTYYLYHSKATTGMPHYSATATANDR